MPVMPPQEARRQGNNAASGQAATPTTTAPAQPPYGGTPGGGQVAPGGTNAGWQDYVSGAQSDAAGYLGQQPNAGEYANMNNPQTQLAYANAQVQQAEQDITTAGAAYQKAITDYNTLQAKANADPSQAILLSDALKNAQMTVDNTYAAYNAAVQRRVAWQGEIYKLLPSSDPNVIAANQAKLVEDNIAAKKATLDYAIYAGHAGTQAEIADKQGQLNNESTEMDNELKRHNMTRVSKDDAYTDALRQQNLDVGALGVKAAQADIDYKAGLTEQAKSGAGLNEANKKNVEAGIPGTTASGEILKQEADAGYGTKLTAGVEADTAGKQIANAQTEAGPDSTFINQLGKAIADPTNPMSSTTAADLYFNHVYGGSQLERKQEANKQASGLLSTMATSGMVVAPGQQYIRGAEPGGTFQNVMGRLGNTGYNPQPIHTFSAPAFAANAGIDISPTQGLPTQSPFTPQGGANPAFQSPNMAGNSPGFAGQVAGAKQPVVLGNMTPREYQAMRQGGAA